MLAPRKRFHSESDDAGDSSLESSSSAEEEADEYSSDISLDISSALTGRKRRRTEEDASDAEIENGDDDLDIGDIIRDSISKRNTKEGTGVVKSAKGGRNKLTKGEVGGGSFQSMGA